MAAAGGVLAAANGRFNPAIACTWDYQNIKEHATSVFSKPAEWGVTDPAVINDLKFAVPAVNKLLTAKLVFDVSAGLKATKDPTRADSGFVDLHFEGIDFPSYTVFDFFGWLLSISAVPPPGAHSKNYYLPLLSCYARWCLTIAGGIGQEKQAPAMVSIAWFQSPSPSNERFTVFLGATIPDQRTFTNPLNRVTVVTNGRQQRMTAHTCGLTAAEPIQMIDNNQVNGTQGDTFEPAGGFGRCAETFFWIYAKEKRLKGKKNKVRGFALRPRGRAPGSPQVTTLIPPGAYNEAAASRALADPCEASCQSLAAQIDSTWATPGWRPVFGIAVVRQELNNPPAAVAAAPANNASARPSLAGQALGMAGTLAATHGPALAAQHAPALLHAAAGVAQAIQNTPGAKK